MTKRGFAILGWLTLLAEQSVGEAELSRPVLRIPAAIRRVELVEAGRDGIDGPVVVERGPLVRVVTLTRPGTAEEAGDAGLGAVEDVREEVHEGREELSLSSAQRKEHEKRSASHFPVWRYRLFSLRDEDVEFSQLKYHSSSLEHRMSLTETKS